MKSILFVDDNQLLCRLSCDILQREGYHTVGAYSGADALKAFEREPFDIVITDLRMDGMNGLELARAIRGKDPHVPVILVTAYDPVESDDITACLPKEELFPKLLQRIRLALAERSLAQTTREH
ncbi:MAG: response regulator [Terriglobales bacterium]